MPFTPFHLGPALLIGLILIPLLDLPTFVVANLIVDLEPLLVLLLGLPRPLHGPFHSLTVGAPLALGVALIMGRVGGFVEPLTAFLGLGQKPRLGGILSASLFGVWLHVLLDALLYPELRPLYPLAGNRLLGLASSGAVYGFCSAAFPLALLVYLLRLFLLRRGGGG